MPAVPPPPTVQLVLSDVDGTLVTPDKQLTDATIDAVQRLGAAGIRFAVTSGRPPRGMEMLVEPLGLTTPIAAFNGGVFVDSSMKVTEQHVIPAHVAGELVETVLQAGVDCWVYRGADWLVLDGDAPHVQRESRTVGFAPEVVASFDSVVAGAATPEGAIAKVCGVSDDHALVETAEAVVRDRFGDHVAASRSQPYYLDVTHPNANKGAVVDHLAALYDIPHAAIVALGDMPNDVLAFGRAGAGIAMGNADREVQRAARHVTRSNDRDGFAHAVDRWVLGTHTSRKATP